MKILVIGKFATEQLGLHVAETFEEMGHTVVRYCPGIEKNKRGGSLSRTWTKIKKIAWRVGRKMEPVRKLERAKLFKAVDKEQPRLVVECGSFLFPDEVAHIQESTGARCAIWFPDSVGHLSRQKFILGDYDGLFSKDPYIVQAFRRRLSLEAFYLPECFNPARHRPSDERSENSSHSKYECELTVAGNVYPYRARFFEQLAEYDVKIWGDPPPVWLDVPDNLQDMLQREFVADEQKAKAFRDARIVLNNLAPTEIWGVNARTFEAAGVGAFQLMDRQPGLHQLYEEGEEVECFSDTDELLEKIDYYLEHDDERREISRAARERSMREHTYENRLETLLSTVFEDGEGFPMPDIDWCPRGDGRSSNSIAAQ